jgi:GGDEF domain-containing protein
VEGHRWGAAEALSAPRHPRPATGARTTSDSTRARRFALPDLNDPRTEESIDAYLAGPATRRGRPGATEPIPFAAGHPFDGLLARVAWLEALARESTRQERYGRPAAVVVFDVEASRGVASLDDWLGRIAGPIAHAIRRGARETDLVTRVGPARFQVLLPETTELEASRYADRVVADCRIWLGAMGAPVGLRSIAAAPTGESTLEDALELALGQLPTD